MVPAPGENGIKESLEIVSVVESPDSPGSEMVPAPAELLF